MYTFEAFSPDSFEQFVRALSIKILGPGVTTFGNGPDGGREATFNGRIDFPHPPQEIWDGYGVIQAKFKEKVEGTQRGQSWAFAQLNAELTKWEQSDRRKLKPEYYIFVTNVELSSGSGGGRDKLTTLFAQYKHKLGLKGWAIWDANQLCSYLQGQSEIRRRFLQFFTPGDMLAQFAQSMARLPDADAVLTAYLAREILADEYARLSQGGDRSESRISLARIFIDLPADSGPAYDIREKAPDEDGANSLKDLLRASEYKLDPLAFREGSQRSRDTAIASESSDRCIVGRFVFLGGPGSGKSTIGQFLAQINRAALLDRRATHCLESKVVDAIAKLKAQCEADDVCWPKVPRYPFRVELNEFAKRLASDGKNEVKSLSEFLRRKLSPDLLISHQDLRDWLKAYPWLLVLDGLDEVPTSSNRLDVVAAINSFLGEARDAGADLMVVASSRPDGYAGEFDGEEVRQIRLRPLSTKRAMKCAQRYLTAIVGSAEDARALQAMSILCDAVENPLVAHLMRSPLQVTFMVTVVAAGGKPSDSRWQLFSDYYRTIYERELQKSVPPFARVLSVRRSDIDMLHQRVGITLQHRSELVADSDMRLDEFNAMVDRVLDEDGLDEDERKVEKELIVEAARQRLVFLTSRTHDRLGFEVRSLQEYMAAAAMTSANSEEVMLRLEKIAHSAYWQNTLLFAVGRFFVDTRLREYRHRIRTMCDDLNKVGSIERITRQGSRVALEIIASGMASTIPRIQRGLAECALQLLSIPIGDGFGAEAWMRLAEVYVSDLEQEFADAASMYLGQSEMQLKLSAWMMVLRLEQKGVKWALAAVERYWPASLVEQGALLEMWFQTFSGDSVGLDANIPRLGRFCKVGSVLQCASILRAATRLPRFETLLLAYPLGNWPELFVLSRWLKASSLLMHLLVDGVESGVIVDVTPVFPDYATDLIDAIDYANLTDHPSAEWHYFLYVKKFFRYRSPSSLADVLDWIEENVALRDIEVFDIGLGWIGRSLVSAKNGEPGLAGLSQRLRGLRTLNLDRWKRKVNEWQAKGITLEDLSRSFIEGGPTLFAGVRRQGVVETPCETAARVSRVLVEAAETNVALVDMARRQVAVAKTAGFLEPELLERVLLRHCEHIGSDDFVVPVEALKTEWQRWLAFFDAVGRMPNLLPVHDSERIAEALLGFVVEGFEQDSNRLGLLQLAGLWCASGLKPNSEVVSLAVRRQLRAPRDRLADVLLRIAACDDSTASATSIVNDLSPIFEERNLAHFQVLLLALQHHIACIPVLAGVVEALLVRMPREESRLHALANEILCLFLRGRGSRFSKEELDRMGAVIS